MTDSRGILFETMGEDEFDEAARVYYEAWAVEEPEDPRSWAALRELVAEVRRLERVRLCAEVEQITPFAGVSHFSNDKLVEEVELVSKHVVLRLLRRDMKAGTS